MSTGNGALRAREFERVVWEEGNSPAAAADVLRVHDWSYLRHLQARYYDFRIEMYIALFVYTPYLYRNRY